MVPWGSGWSVRESVLESVLESVRESVMWSVLESAVQQHCRGRKVAHSADVAARLLLDELLGRVERCELAHALAEHARPQQRRLD